LIQKSPDPETPLELLPAKAIPRWYRRVEISYSKFGVEDFDFGFYNRTPYAGLETHVANSYTNSFVQLLHYCLPVRLLATAHISRRCEREACLACELGFVFRMLEDARGAGGEVGHCQAANLGRVLGMIPQGMHLLIES
jgi:PAB-dependent poly(A)-specific ribonuclease subunit 2